MKETLMKYFIFACIALTMSSNHASRELRSPAQRDAVKTLILFTHIENSDDQKKKDPFFSKKRFYKKENNKNTTPKNSKRPLKKIN